LFFPSLRSTPDHFLFCYLILPSSFPLPLLPPPFSSPPHLPSPPSPSIWCGSCLHAVELRLKPALAYTNIQRNTHTQVLHPSMGPLTQGSTYLGVPHTVLRPRLRRERAVTPPIYRVPNLHSD